MFTIERKHETLLAKEIEEGHAFEDNGEIMVRIPVPNEMLSPKLGLTKTSVLAISLSSWQIKQLDPHTDVYPYEVNASAKLIAINH